MYRYVRPTPIEIPLGGADGFALRQQAAAYIQANQNLTGAQRGSTAEQTYGAVAEIVIRSRLGLPVINPAEHPLGYDYENPHGVKADVKCRGGELPFQEEYMNSDGVAREAKHNLFARQVHDERLDTDIYVLSHLRRPKGGVLPGTQRQSSWVLYVCGWISKERARREGVYLPAGAISERGNEWFAYRAHEIEFYNKNLNGLAQLSDLMDIEPADVAADAAKVGDLNMTRVDTLRVGFDLAGRGILPSEKLTYIKAQTRLDESVKPFLHPNQAAHVLHWLLERGQLTQAEYEAMVAQLRTVAFTGLGNGGAEQS